jgi:hypothetical protein
MTNNKAREVNNPIIKQLLGETTAEELAKIDTEMTNNKQQTAVNKAKELIEKMTKQYALIAVDELIQDNEMSEILVNGGLQKQFWEEVKQEIITYGGGEQ